jgi:hypothetical protein
MIAPGQDLPSRQVTDILKILFTFRQIPPPAVITNQHKSIFLCDHLPAVSQKLLFMFFPHPVVQLILCFQNRLEMQVQIPDRV